MRRVLSFGFMMILAAPVVHAQPASAPAPAEDKTPAVEKADAAEAKAVAAAPAAPDTKAVAPVAPSAAPAIPRVSLLESITGGKPSVMLRYRYEYYDQDGLADDGRASTQRIAIGYETKPFKGFSLLGQFEGVASLGNDLYRIPTVPHQNKTTRPIIADPIGNELNQAYLKYASSKLTVKVGRQDYFLNNSRFISISTWRQDNQTLDAAQVLYTPTKSLSLNYVFIDQVNRVVGNKATDGQLKMSSHVFNGTFKRPNRVSLAAYGLMLDYETAPANSTNTFGLRVEGPYKLSDSLALVYAAEYANQRAAGDNPASFAVNYILGEVGVLHKGMTYKVQYSVRGGSGANRLQAPLAHPWDGFVEKWLITPENGLKVASGTIAGSIKKLNGLSFAFTAYDYSADTGGMHYGRELDYHLEYRFLKLDKNWAIGTRFGYYQADDLLTDSLRTSVFTSYAF